MSQERRDKELPDNENVLSYDRKLELLLAKKLNYEKDPKMLVPIRSLNLIFNERDEYRAMLEKHTGWWSTETHWSHEIRELLKKWDIKEMLKVE